VRTKLCHYDFLPWVMQACGLSDTYALGRAKAYTLLCNVCQTSPQSGSAGGN
jgi:hypothetical protein